jgi:predicted transcriptional regulator
LDYFWLLGPIWAGFGALLSGIVLGRLDISRTSYRKAKQMLSAMVCSLSTRMEQNEVLTKELSEQLQILSANQARLNVEGQTGDKERLLGFMQDWMGNLKRVIQKVDGLQKNVKNVEQEVQEIRFRVDQLSVTRRERAGASVTPVGVVTEDTLAKLSPTEKGVLELLVGGPKAAPEIGQLIMKSREHTGRLMKSLFEQGFVEREANRQPYEYRLNDKVREVMQRAAHHEATQSVR